MCVGGSFIALRRTNSLDDLIASDPHHAPECVLYMRVLGVSEHSFKQQRVLCDPLMGFGLHVPESHPLTLRMSLHPLGQQKNTRTKSQPGAFQMKTIFYYLIS